uniref:Glycosyltransferase family 92 protein n=1 Tax=Ceratitis capitata TaxID=7213 RepID=W8BSX1_CERCA
MRKYQQLLLVLISCISIVVLLTYKSENSRLKDVLTAVHFFSRKDVEELRLITNFTASNEVNIDFNRPLPVWQRIADSFYAYASFYQRNELMSSGGEILTLVTGKVGAVVNFRCKALYKDGRQIQGKFRFQHLNQENNKSDDEFKNYIFYCRLKSYSEIPYSIVYTDLSVAETNMEHKLRLRYITKNQENNAPQTQMTICLDLINFNMSSSFAYNYAYMLEFFLHHFVIGVNQFIVYNGDELSEDLLRRLRKEKDIHVQSLPFNFPFANNGTSTSSLREIITTDCLLRSIQRTKYALLLEPNEFFIPNTKLSNDNSVVYSLNSHNTIETAFELKTYAVCTDHKIILLTNNSFHDPEFVNSHKINIFRPVVPVSSTISNTVNLSPSLGFAHKYIDCLHVGKDGLHPWQNTMREDFMNNLNMYRREVDKLIAN